MKDKYNSVNQLMKDKNDDKIITSSEREDREEIQSTIPLIEEINTNILRRLIETKNSEEIDKYL